MTESNIKQTGGGESVMRREVSIIPGWAYVLAVLVFIGIPMIFWTLIWPHEEEHHAPIFFMFIPLIPAVFLAFYVLMIGYVNRDSGRRGMSRTLWTIIVIFVPNAIGFILYFVLRNPIQTQCPKCAGKVSPAQNYCPNCGYGFHLTCAHCKAPVQPADAFCGKCGAQLEQRGG